METIASLSFAPFGKIPRLSRNIVVTEKIDGTNAQICILPKADFDRAWDDFLSQGPDTRPHSPYSTAAIGDFVLLAGSRTRWVRPKNPGEKGDPDNYGFAAWCRDNAKELFKLGPGRHYGEWYGSGINRAYGLTEKRFALFNVSRWHPLAPPASLPGVYEIASNGDIVDGPSCCYVVPTLYTGLFKDSEVEHSLDLLRCSGSRAVPGFADPEGVIVFHTAGGYLFKKTIKDDESPKGVPGLTNGQQLANGVEASNHVFKVKCNCK